MAAIEQRDTPGRRATDTTREQSWQAVSTDEAVTALDSGPGGPSEAEVREGQMRSGPNRLPPPRRRGPFLRFFAQFHDILIYVLLGATVVTALLGHWVGAEVILAVVLVNAVIGFLQEGKAENALKAISISVLVVTAMLTAAPQALADAVISGPPCVVDGNTIQVGGKVRDGKCWGGIEVRLRGSKAPQLNKVCKDSRGLEWPCGRVAASALSDLIRPSKIDCYHHDGEFIEQLPLATCISGRVDLASEMVLKGMSRAADENTPRYILQENAARKARRGIWK